MPRKPSLPNKPVRELQLARAVNEAMDVAYAAGVANNNLFQDPVSFLAQSMVEFDPAVSALTGDPAEIHTLITEWRTRHAN